MGLLDDLLAASKRTRPGPKCAIGRHLTSLDDDQRAELIAIIDHPDIEPVVIAAHYAPVVEFTVGALGHHRGHKCQGCQDAGYFPKR